jgi:hypothetical protein
VVTKYTAFTESSAQKYKLKSGSQKQRLHEVSIQLSGNEKPEERL